MFILRSLFLGDSHSILSLMVAMRIGYEHHCLRIFSLHASVYNLVFLILIQCFFLLIFYKLCIYNILLCIYNFYFLLDCDEKSKNFKISGYLFGSLGTMNRSWSLQATSFWSINSCVWIFDPFDASALDWCRNQSVLCPKNQKTGRGSWDWWDV